jgi:DNA polymerase I
LLNQYREIVLVDFEFEAHRGERPVPVCCVAHELRSGRWFRIWQDEFGPAPPYATGPDVLFVAFYASAELGCYRVLGWPMPERILDLFVEFRVRTLMANPIEQGWYTPAGRGLLGALTYFGLDTMAATEKHELQKAIGDGSWRGRFSPAEIFAYCQHDVEALARLLPLMAPKIDWPRALFRGRFMAAVSVMEYYGVPIDVETLDLLRENWDLIKDRLIAEIDKDFGVYEGTTFKLERFAALLNRLSIAWPRTDTGRLATDDDTFREMAKTYPVLSPLRELRHAISDLRLNDLTVGSDGRNRVMLSAFSSRTGRSQPSNTEFIFGTSVWMRGLIKPPPGYGVALVDWTQQEFGVAGVMSNDKAMQAAYLSGDPYLEFAKQAGAVPAEVTKESLKNEHKSYKPQRALYKQCVLAVQYGQGAEGLADRIGMPVVVARGLLQSHHEIY